LVGLASDNFIEKGRAANRVEMLLIIVKGYGKFVFREVQTI
jgi:hypothetical protein